MSTPLLLTSVSFLKGVEYAGIYAGANAVRFTEPTRLSVNRSPFVEPPVNEDILIHPNFTYSTEQDTFVWLSRVTQPDLTIIINSTCATQATLTQNVESASLCSLTLEQAVTTGEVTVAATVENDKTNTCNYIIRVYKNSVLVHTGSASLPSKVTGIVSMTTLISAPASIGDVVTFTIEADTDLQTNIIDVNHVNHIQINKTT